MLDNMGAGSRIPTRKRGHAFAATPSKKAVIIVAPMLVGMMVIGDRRQHRAGRLPPTGKKMKPDFKRMNPFKGLKRMSAQAWWELGQVGVEDGRARRRRVPRPRRRGRTPSPADGGIVVHGRGQSRRETTLTLLRNVAGVGLVIAALDYTVQRRRVNAAAADDQAGGPRGDEAARRQPRDERARCVPPAMSISRNRMIRMVSDGRRRRREPDPLRGRAASYDAAKGAPQVIAKGAGVVAAAIRAEAEKHGLPIVHEPVLTRALYRTCEIGQLIPVELYEAVAHLLAFVFGLRGEGPGRGLPRVPPPALL